MEEVEAIIAGRPRRLLYKDLSAARSKPRFLGDPAREISAYLDVLGPGEVDAPACYAAMQDPPGLLLELVEGEALWQVGDFETWEEAAGWLARLHGAGLERRATRLLRYGPGYFRAWLPRARAFAPGGSLNALASSYTRVVDRLASWPATFVHGEFYPSNVLVEGRRVRPVDWEMAGVGPGVLDLAALSSGWDDESRERLARAYFEECPRRLRGSGWEDFRDALEHGRLHVAVQWLGWSRVWTPPSEHAHDWLAEARGVIGRLGL
jgi:aminoglycoside phosphotransferase (APT) family kinase protein